MRVIFDGSHLYNPRQAGYKYVVSLLARVAREEGFKAVVTASPTGVFDDVFNDVGGNVEVHRRRGRWLGALPWGPLRGPLSQLRRYLQDRNVEKNAAPEEAAIFHSFYYTPPPNDRCFYVPAALDAIPERLGGEVLAATAPEILTLKREAFRRAHHITAISEQTRKDVSEIYGIAPERITTVPLGTDFEYFSTPATTPARERTPFFLQVGGRLHHKNFATLVEAFATSKLTKDYQLVCVGDPWEESEKLLLQKHGVASRTRLVQTVTEDELRALYQASTALVYPSLYEGFGIPVVEAMASGTAVAASRIPVVQEVGASAIEYFDPRDASDIGRALVALTAKKKRQERVNAGISRAKLFSWDRTAERLLEVFRGVVAGSATRSPSRRA